ITGADIAHVPTEDKKQKRVANSVSEKEKVIKKKRTQKKKAPSAGRKLVIQEEDNEETDEEPLQLKRKRTESDKDQ
ncbi:hypothetical protein A2U01_0100457, partial [Trifolium medium]|nr:hypothetical protein [Trifolium medium]